MQSIYLADYVHLICEMEVNSKSLVYRATAKKSQGLGDNTYDHTEHQLNLRVGDGVQCWKKELQALIWWYLIQCTSLANIHWDEAFGFVQASDIWSCGIALYVMVSTFKALVIPASLLQVNEQHLAGAYQYLQRYLAKQIWEPTKNVMAFAAPGGGWSYSIGVYWQHLLTTSFCRAVVAFGKIALQEWNTDFVAHHAFPSPSCTVPSMSSVYSAIL